MSFLLETFSHYVKKGREDPVKRQEEFGKRVEKNSFTRDQERTYTNVEVFKPATMYGDQKIHPMYEHWTQILGHQPNKRRQQ